MRECGRLRGIGHSVLYIVDMSPLYPTRPIDVPEPRTPDPVDRVPIRRRETLSSGLHVKVEGLTSPALCLLSGERTQDDEVRSDPHATTWPRARLTPLAWPLNHERRAPAARLKYMSAPSNDCTPVFYVGASTPEGRSRQSESTPHCSSVALCHRWSASTAATVGATHLQPPRSNRSLPGQASRPGCATDAFPGTVLPSGLSPCRRRGTRRKFLPCKGTSSSLSVEAAYQ
jgi:hypothetical protein